MARWGRHRNVPEANELQAPRGGTAHAEALLGVLEAAIMAHCWAAAEAAGALDGAPQTVAEVQQALTMADRTPAYTTVMTVMGRLVEKGLLRRSESVGRSGPGSGHRYWPAQSEADFIAATSRARVAALVATFGDVALAQFADALGTLDPERLAALARLGQGAQAPRSAEPGRAAATEAPAPAEASVEALEPLPGQHPRGAEKQGHAPHDTQGGHP